jgi:hypothetical protein
MHSPTMVVKPGKRQGGDRRGLPASSPDPDSIGFHGSAAAYFRNAGAVFRLPIRIDIL